jgi:hypothetical protein
MGRGVTTLVRADACVTFLFDPMDRLECPALTIRTPLVGDSHFHPANT